MGFALIQHLKSPLAWCETNVLGVQPSTAFLTKQQCSWEQSRKARLKNKSVAPNLLAQIT